MPVKLSDICYITGWSKQRIEKWFADGYFRQIDRETGDPVDNPEPGKPRAWSMHDVMRLICFMRLVEMGCRVDAGRAIGRLHGFHDETAYYVCAALDRDIVRRNSGVELGDLHPVWKKVITERGDAKRHISQCLKAGEVATFGRDIGVLGIFVIDLDVIEKEAESLMARVERMARRRDK